MNRYFHNVPWYINPLPRRWQVAWMWLSYFNAGNPVIYPGDLEYLFKGSQPQDSHHD